jgi:hypothetical protein
MKKENNRFIVQFEVDQKWIDDGFTLDDERALEMLINALPFAYTHELKAKVIQAN